MPRNTANKGNEGPLQGSLQTTAQGSQRRHKQMEKPSMLMDRKNQYCKNCHTAQSILQIQCCPYQNTNVIFHTVIKIYSKIYWELNGSLNSQSNPKQKEQSQRYHITGLQTIS